MQHHTNTRIAGTDEMHLRRITLQDGRYMIFYTFDDSPAEHSAATPRPQENPPSAENPVTPESQEERNV